MFFCPSTPSRGISGPSPFSQGLPPTGYFVLGFPTPLSLSLSLAIPQFSLLSHVSSLRLSSGHSGPVLALSMQPTPPCSAPACWWWTRASGLLLHWELQLGEYSLCWFPPTPPVMFPSEIPKLPTNSPVREFAGV